MKIISPFKDYYDFIAHEYGGGDPKIVYVRKPFSKTCYPLEDGYRIEENPLMYTYKSTIHNKYFTNLRWLVCCGRYYLTVFTDNKWILFNEELHNDLYEFLYNRYDKRRKVRWTYFYSDNNTNPEEYINGYTGKDDGKTLLKISQTVEMPVFSITQVNNPKKGYKGTFYIDELVPNLGEMGFASVMGPFQMYQNISYYVGNLLKEVPDNDPPVELSDKEKIEKSGFNLKTSFRHRK